MNDDEDKITFLGYAEAADGISRSVPIWSKEEAEIRANEGLRIASFIKTQAENLLARAQSIKVSDDTRREAEASQPAS